MPYLLRKAFSSGFYDRFYDIKRTKIFFFILRLSGILMKSNDLLLFLIKTHTLIDTYSGVLFLLLERVGDMG